MSKMKNIRLTIAYKGTAYSGWQRTGKAQPINSSEREASNRSIEEALTLAIQTVLQHPIKLQAASRTDAGVHARGQVVNFLSETTLSLRKLQHSLNHLLPQDIVVKEILLEDPSFHPTMDAIKKEYHYEICYGRIQLPFFRETSWHFPHFLNLIEMQKAAVQLLGTHDFSAFCNERALWDRNPVCRIEEINICPIEQQRLKMILIGDHFLYKMVRNLVGTLTYVGCGKLKQEEMPHILLSKDRTLAGVTAPSHGLTLEKVTYIK